MSCCKEIRAELYSVLLSHSPHWWQEHFLGKTDTLEIVIKCLHRQSQIGHQSLSYSLLSWAGTTSLKRESGTISSLRDKCLFSAFTALAEISVLMFSYSKRCLYSLGSFIRSLHSNMVCISLIIDL